VTRRSTTTHPCRKPSSPVLTFYAAMRASIGSDAHPMETESPPSSALIHGCSAEPEDPDGFEGEVKLGNAGWLGEASAGELLQAAQAVPNCVAMQVHLGGRDRGRSLFGKPHTQCRQDVVAFRLRQARTGPRIALATFAAASGALASSTAMGTCSYRTSP
jgi:hypothetical protein